MTTAFSNVILSAYICIEQLEQGMGTNKWSLFSDKLGLAEHKTNMKETTFKKLSVCYMATDEVYTKHV